MTQHHFPTDEDWRYRRDELFAELKSKKTQIDDDEYMLRLERLELGRLLITGVQSDVPIAKMARAAGISRETAYKLMRRWFEDALENDSFTEWHSFEDWLAGLRSTPRDMVERKRG